MDGKVSPLSKAFGGHAQSQNAQNPESASKGSSGAVSGTKPESPLLSVGNCFQLPLLLRIQNAAPGPGRRGAPVGVAAIGSVDAGLVS